METKLMSNIQEIALKKALVLLKASGCTYHVVDMDGEEYGEPIHEKKKRLFKYKYGAVRTYLKPYIENLQEGQVVEVPIGEFNIDSVQSGLASYMAAMYGMGQYITTRSDDGQFVQMIFLGKKDEQQNTSASIPA